MLTENQQLLYIGLIAETKLQGILSEKVAELILQSIEDPEFIVTMINRGRELKEYSRRKGIPVPEFLDRREF
jgi:hypothetical protein